MYSTKTFYWHTSTGPLKHDVRGVSTLSKGRVVAGAFIGDIQAAAGSIGTAELATGAVTEPKLGSLAVGTTKIAAAAVTQPKLGSLAVGTTNVAAAAVTQAKIASLGVGTTSIAAAAVTAPKMSFGWSTLTGTLAGAGTLPAASGGYLITNPGTTKGLVFTSSGTGFSVPTAGDWYKFSIDVTPGTTRVVNLKSTSATFDGTNKVVVFNAADQFLILEAQSATRWVIASAHASVTFAATT